MPHQSVFSLFCLLTFLSIITICTAQTGGIQTVAVGQNNFTFTPDTIFAPVGSVVQFQFYPRNHSVVQGDFDDPCQPKASGNGFYSGYQVVGSGVAPEVFSVTISDTGPIFFYCSQPFATHCQVGMVGVINPSTAGDPPQSLAEYRAASETTNSSSTPAQVQGGIFEVPAPPSNSTSTSAVPPASSTTSTNTYLIGVTLGPAGSGAPTATPTSESTGAVSSASSSANISASSTVSYGGPGACPASSASATKKRWMGDDIRMH
ncbi:Cupredoxin [Viridothelium virens]|uniref:Cupredoxin n=1 Tax=Viridothelium virens TaxID=1048519 RepID=A0A6A6HJE1_VIRVR|nr:Cupredoxin [Viridothelium virens]